MPDANSPEIDTRDAFVIAQERLSRGTQLTQADEKLLDRVLGNGDGSFDQKDRQLIDDRRNDTAFMKNMVAIGTAVTAPLFISEGAMEIRATSLNAPFSMAALGLAKDIIPAEPAQNLTSNPLPKNDFGLSLNIGLRPSTP